MNSDKELLEWAAKAAGMVLWRDPETDSDYWGDASEKYICSVWNPLTDDGDALRLAVKLELNVYCCEMQPGADGVSNHQERANGDPYSATRRVIVRAAAEIGKTMK